MNGQCFELSIKLEYSNLLDVASAIKHGHVIPWTDARKYWANNFITSPELFGLLISSWSGFLNVSCAFRQIIMLQ